MPTFDELYDQVEQEQRSPADALFDEIEGKRSAADLMLDQIEEEQWPIPDQAPQNYELGLRDYIPEPQPWQYPSASFGYLSGYTPGSPFAAENIQEAQAVAPLPVRIPLDVAGKLALRVANLPAEIRRQEAERAGKIASENYPLNIEESLRPSIPRFSEDTQMPVFGPTPLGIIPQPIRVGVANAIIDTANQMIPPFAPPEVGLTIPLTLAGGPAGRLASGLFGGSMAVALPEELIQAGETLASPTATPAQKAEAVARPAVNAYFAQQMLRHGAAELPRPTAPSSTGPETLAAFETERRAIPALPRLDEKTVTQKLNGEAIRERLAQGLKPEHVRITIQNTPEMPAASYVQVDDVTPGLNNPFSTNPEKLRLEGMGDMPTSAELLQLPSGQYTLTEALKLLTEKKTPAAPPAPAPAPPTLEQDVARYAELMAQLKEKKAKGDLRGMTDIAKEVEQIKNRHGGYPPVAKPAAPPAGEERPPLVSATRPGELNLLKEGRARASDVARLRQMVQEAEERADRLNERANKATGEEKSQLWDLSEKASKELDALRSLLEKTEREEAQAQGAKVPQFEQARVALRDPESGNLIVGKVGQAHADIFGQISEFGRKHWNLEDNRATSGDLNRRYRGWLTDDGLFISVADLDKNGGDWNKTVAAVRASGRKPEGRAVGPPPPAPPPKEEKPTWEQNRFPDVPDSDNPTAGAIETVARLNGLTIEAFKELPGYERHRMIASYTAGRPELEALARMIDQKQFAAVDEWFRFWANSTGILKTEGPNYLHERTGFRRPFDWIQAEKQKAYVPSETLGPKPDSPEYNALSNTAKGALHEFELNQRAIDTGLHSGGQKVTPKQMEELKERQKQVRINYENAVKAAEKPQKPLSPDADKRLSSKNPGDYHLTDFPKLFQPILALYRQLAKEKMRKGSRMESFRDDFQTFMVAAAKLVRSNVPLPWGDEFAQKYYDDFDGLRLAKDFTPEQVLSMWYFEMRLGDLIRAADRVKWEPGRIEQWKKYNAIHGRLMGAAKVDLSGVDQKGVEGIIEQPLLWMRKRYYVTRESNLKAKEMEYIFRIADRTTGTVVQELKDEAQAIAEAKRLNEQPAQAPAPEAPQPAAPAPEPPKTPRTDIEKEVAELKASLRELEHELAQAKLRHDEAYPGGVSQKTEQGVIKRLEFLIQQVKDQISVYDEPYVAEVKPLNFTSGAERNLADLDTVIANKQPVGVTARDIVKGGILSPTVRRKLIDYLNSGGTVFIDSGAVRAYLTGTEVDFPEVMFAYKELANNTRHPENVYVVAPDVVGDPAKTKALQKQFGPELEKLSRSGVNIIYAAQKTPGAKLADVVRDTVPVPPKPERRDVKERGNYIVGLPFNDNPWTPEEIAAWLKENAAKKLSVHLLGGGATDVAWLVDAAKKAGVTLEHVSGDGHVTEQNRGRRFPSRKTGKKSAMEVAWSGLMTRVHTHEVSPDVTAAEKAQMREALDRWQKANLGGDKATQAQAEQDLRKAVARIEGETVPEEPAPAPEPAAPAPEPAPPAQEPAAPAPEPAGDKLNQLRAKLAELEAAEAADVKEIERLKAEAVSGKLSKKQFSENMAQGQFLAKRIEKRSPQIANLRGEVGLERMRAEAAPFMGQPEPEATQRIPPKVLKEQKSTLLDMINAALKHPMAGEKVTFDVPGDGTFIVENNKERLEKFKGVVESYFPTTAGGPSKPGLASTKPTALAKVAEPEAEALPGITKNFASEEKTRGTIQYTYADGTQLIATDGKQLIRIVTDKAPGSLTAPVLLDKDGNPLSAEEVNDLGQFPNWKIVMPENPTLALGGLDTGQLFHLVRQAQVFRDSAVPKNKRSAYTVEIFINPDRSLGARMEIGGEKFEHNIQEGALSAGRYNPEPLVDVMQAARRLGNEKVDLYVDGELGPAVFRGKNFEHALMPYRESSESKEGLRDTDFNKVSGRAMYGRLPEGFGPLDNPERARSMRVETDIGKNSYLRATVGSGNVKIEIVTQPADRWSVPSEQLIIEMPIAEWQTKKGQIAFRDALKPNFTSDVSLHAGRTGDAVKYLLKERDAALSEAKARQGKAAGGKGQAYAEAERLEPRPLDPFKLTDAELDALFRERFGDLGRVEGAYTADEAKLVDFPSYEEFRRWMDARYAERNLEHMKRVFAEADVEWKKRYIKDTKNDPATDQLKKDVMAHISVGAPLPPAFVPVAPPPVSGPAPGPRPGAGPRPGPGPGPSGPGRQQPPPPPPRTPTPYPRYDFMALTQLFRYFDRFPEINRIMRALGKHWRPVGIIELKNRLLHDKALAERVLGHEIGHFIDLILTPRGVGARDVARKIAPLKDFRRLIGERAAINQAAKLLSTRWRGPFLPTDRYRNSANELFADVMSAIFNDPEMVNRDFPILHDTFEQLRRDKPNFERGYQLLNAWLRGDLVVDEWLKQQRHAIVRTMDDLLSSKRAPQQTFWEKIKQATVSMWYRAYGVEGKPKQLGGKRISELEISHVWHDAQDALFFDDWLKSVKPHMDKINPDPTQARANLHAYLVADRTIKEARAAGIFIRTDPGPARVILNEITDPSKMPELSRFNYLVRTVPDAGLYDLGARIIRLAWDQPKLVRRRLVRLTNRLRLGVKGDALLMAFNVRGKMLNPGGLTPDRAEQVMRVLRQRMTPEQWAATERAAQEFRAMVFDVVSKAHDEGLISDQAWDEYVKPNAQNYVSFAVLDHWNGEVPAMEEQAGTAKDIADATIATQLKVSSLNMWRQRQRQVQLLMEAYERGGNPVDVGKVLRESSDLAKERADHRYDDISRAVLWVDGKPHLVEFPGDAGKTFEEAMEYPGFYHHLQLINTLNRFTHGYMSIFTTFSPPFMVYRNPIRDWRTSQERIGTRAAVKQSFDVDEQMKNAWNYAEAAFGGEMNPTIRDLVAKQVLMPPRLATSVVKDAANLQSLIEQGSLMAYHMRRLSEEHWPWWKGGEKGREATQFAEKVFASYEALAKIQSYKEALLKGLTEEEAIGLARVAGIPNPAVAGKWSTPLEIMFPWLRVHIQGIRADWNVLKDPKLRKGFVTRSIMFEGLPRVAKVAIALGFANGLIRSLYPGAAPDDIPPIAEAFRRISPYKMALDDIIPLGWHDPRTGEYHLGLNTGIPGSKIPQHWEVVSWRIPASEQGRLWGTLLYQSLSGLPKAKEQLSRPGYGIAANLWTWLRDYGLVGANPLAETVENAGRMAFLGQNPEDSFTGRPAANRELYEAGGKERAEAVAAYVLQRFGEAGFIATLAAINLGLFDQRTLNTLQSRLDGQKQSIIRKIPLLKNMLSFDNYARYRDEMNQEIADKMLRAKAKLVMSPEVHQLYQYYWRNQDRVDKMDQADKTRFYIAQGWVNGVWGDAKTEGSMYSKAMHAVGPDGSQGARDTVRKDLDLLSAAFLQMFKDVKDVEGIPRAAVPLYPESTNNPVRLGPVHP